MRRVLAIDPGTSKTAAVLLEHIGNKIVRSEEFVCGSNQVMVKNNFNFSLWQNVVREALSYFSRNNKLKNCDTVITLPRGLINFERETYDRKKANLKKLLRLREKDQLKVYLEPLLGRHEIFWPFITRTLYLGLLDFFRRERLKLRQIYFSLPFYSAFAEPDNFAILNLGGRGCDMLLYQQKELQRIVSFQAGGEQVVNDIALVQQVSENLARNKFFSTDRLFESFFKKSDDLLVRIIDERIAEIFRLIKSELSLPVEAIYITGGLANCSRLPELLENFLKIKVVNLNEKIQERSFLFLNAYLMAEHYIRS